MLTKDIRQTIDNARDVLVGKIPNPQSQIEQITIAMIYKFMDDMDSESVEFGGERQYFVKELEKYSWTKVMSSQLGNDDRMKLYKEALEKLPLSEQIPKLFRNIFKGAYLPYNDSKTLTLFLKEIDELSYNNSENLGNGFEYLLSIMGSQGDAGMFRTPRHIIDFIVNVVQPKKTDTILDPACGTAGFLISAYKYILQDAKENNQVLTPAELTTLTENIQGYDISPDMVKLALVNMYLHKFKDPKIYEYDTLTSTTRWESYFDCILANPPFMTPKGGIQPHNKFGVKANRSEVLFVDYIMEHINSTGKAGIVVPEGIVFQSANAYKELRKKLVTENNLYTVVSLPSGVFNPYAGVKTSILLLDKQLAKKTDKILFVEVKQDGYDLGAQRRETPDKNDLPEALELLHKWQDSINTKTEFSTESKLVTIVEKSKLAEGEEYNLTASRYKETQDYSNCKWSMVKLGDIAQIKGGKRLPKGESFANQVTSHPYIRVADFKENTIDTSDLKYIDNNIFNQISNYTISSEDVYISIAGTIGLTGTIPKELNGANLTENAAKIVINNIEQLCPKFLSYCMQSEYIQAQIKTLTHAVGVPKLALERIRTIEIPLPPLEVQKEIVQELDGYQAVIDGAQKVVDNWKPTFTTNPAWKEVKIGSLCSLSTGGTPTSTVPAYYDNGNIKWLVSGDIHKGQIYDCEGRITELGMNSSNAKYLPENSVLIALNGQGKTRGTVAMLRTKATCNQSLVAINPNDSKILKSEFLYYYLKSLYKYIRGLTGDNQRSGLNMPIIREISIKLPPIEEQEDIVSKIEAEEKIVEECKKLIKLHQEKIDNKIKSIWGEDSE